MENFKVICLRNDGYYQLTEGKVYETLYGIEEGFFESRPFVTVIGDNGKPLTAHYSRFKKVEENGN